VPYVRQGPEVSLFGFVSTRCIAFEVLIKASFIKKMVMTCATIASMSTEHASSAKDFF
jgi:hypothetical protein